VKKTLVNTMILGIDTGASFTRIWDGSNPVLKTKTPFEYDEYLEFLEQTLTANPPVQHLALALPGVIEDQRITSLPNLGASWQSRDIKTDLTRMFPALETVAVLQDTHAAAYGIQRHEQLTALPALVVTLSTGVGGALIADGYVSPLEIGHIPLNLRHQNTLCVCGQVGCVEADISGSAIYKRLGVRAEEVHDPAFWKEYAFHLGQCLSVLTLLFKLKQIVLMGGICNKGDYFLSETQSYLERNITYVPIPHIKVSTLGDHAGVYGAYEVGAALARGRKIPLP
jgi:predicted NBD/HSP70 family sugar kinase